MAFFEGKVSAREFLVDFFGALMPGVFFLIFLFISLIGPIFLSFQATFCFFGDDKFLTVLDVLGTSELNVLDQIGKIPVVLDVAIFIVFLAIGYIVGTLFYRQDPKIPDHKSFLKIINGFSIEQEVRTWVARVPVKKDSNLTWIHKLIIRFFSPYWKYMLFNAVKQGVSGNGGDDGHGSKENSKEEANILGDANSKRDLDEHSYNTPKTMNKYNVLESDVQFPYNNLKEYLQSRGWNELADKIRWSYHEGAMPENYPRSKTFINSLKIWLQFHFPEKCSTIVKNEAHVRLSSSMWYVSSKLMVYSLLGVVFTFISGFLFWCSSVDGFNGIIKEVAFFFILSSSVLIMSWRIRGLVESFLHYQRVREIFYVLTTANFAEQSLKKESKSQLSNSDA